MQQLHIMLTIEDFISCRLSVAGLHEGRRSATLWRLADNQILELPHHLPFSLDVLEIRTFIDIVHNP